MNIPYVPSYTFMGGEYNTMDLLWRFTHLGLPAHIIKPFLLEVDKWVSNSGPAWAVSRLKGLRTDLLRQKAELPPLTWIKKNSKGGIFGPVGGLFRYALKSDKAFRKALIALSCYTGFRPSEPSIHHCLKFREAVEGHEDEAPQHLCDNLQRVAGNRLGVLTVGETVPLILYRGHPGKCSPGLHGSVPQDDYLETDVDWFRANADMEEFSSVYANLYNPVLEGLNHLHQLLPYHEKWLGKTSYHVISDVTFHRSHAHPPLAGNVVPLTKDGGYKVRWIANPFRIHQLALKPLGDALFKSIRSLPWDCTFEQERPISVIQEHLRKGGVAHAVDLTAATDHFPLSLQLSVLQGIIPQRDLILLFRDLSRAVWRSPIGPVRWTKGQPMGLYPSFPSFALTHGILLYYLNKETFQDDFFILGDDVIILKDDLHQCYLEVMRSLECPIDEWKSFSSNKLTEFAGKVITHNQVYPKFKIGMRGSHHDSFMDLMRTYGQSFRFFFPKRIRKVYEQVAHLFPPFGANHSLGPAKKYEQILLETLEFEELMGDSGDQKLHVGFLKFLSDQLKPGRTKSLWHSLGKGVIDLCRRFERNVYQAKKSSPVPLLHEDLTDVLEFTGETFPDLQPVSTAQLGIGRKTLLQFYEEKLKKLKDQTHMGGSA